MKICHFDGQKTGLIKGDYLYDISASIPSAEKSDAVLWAASLPASRALELIANSPRLSLEGIRFSSPILAPGKVVAAPVNYKAHIEEMMNTGQAHGHLITDIRKAGMFLKASSSVTGEAGGIAQRFLDRRTDHEIELCAVIGKTVNNTSVEDALSCVAGYCLGLDITVRGPEDRSFRKSMDTYCVLGPWMVTPDEAGDPNDITLTLKVNGEVRQHTNTSDMVMNVAELIAYASTFYTLHRGDVLMTGTPQGVGPIRPGDKLHATGTRLGDMNVSVYAA